MGGGWWPRHDEASEFVFDRGSVAPDADGVVTIGRLGPGSYADVVGRVRQIRSELESLPGAGRARLRVDVGPVSAVRAAQLHQEMGAPVVVRRNDLIDEARLPIGVRVEVQITPVKVEGGRRVAVDAADATEFVFDAAAPRVPPDVSSLVPGADGVVRLSRPEGMSDEEFGLFVHDAREVLNQAEVVREVQDDPAAAVRVRVEMPDYAQVQVEGGGPMTAVQAAELGSRIGAPVVVKAEDLREAHAEGLLTGEGPNGDSVAPMKVDRQGRHVPADVDEATEFVYYGAQQRDRGVPDDESAVGGTPVSTPKKESGASTPVEGSVAGSTLVEGSVAGSTLVEGAGGLGVGSLFDRDGSVTVRPRPGQSDGEVAAEVRRLQSTFGKLPEGDRPPVRVDVGRRVSAVEALELWGVFRAPVVVRRAHLDGGHDSRLVTGDSVVPMKDVDGRRVVVPHDEAERVCV